MNCNEFKHNYHPRGRNRNFRGRGIRAVNIQRPVTARVGRTSTKRAVSTNPTSSTSSIKWKNQSSLSIHNVTTTITKSTSSKTFSTSFGDSRVVIAIAAGRGEAACEIGIAALDICKPTLIMCQISDTSSYINTLTKINILNPDEVHYLEAKALDICKPNLIMCQISDTSSYINTLTKINILNPDEVHYLEAKALDICKPTLIMCQISDTSSYINTLTKINILNPDEILLPMTLIDAANTNRLLNKIKQHFQNVIITAVPRASYNKLAGLQSIKELCAPEWDSIIIVLQHKYYCLTAAAALLTYTESSLCVIYNRKSLKVEYQESEGYCIIDVSTADKLELVNSNSATPNDRYSSIFGILNYCFTRIGARALRTAILQPSCSVPDIEARLDCITELKRNSDMINSIRTILPRISNIDNLLSLATLPSEQGDNFNERHLAYVLTLNVLLDLLEALREVFDDSELPFFKEIRSTLDDESFKQLKHELRSVIQPDAHPAKGQQAIIEKCFLIKPGVNGLLDVLRKTYSERVEDLREYVTQLRDKYNLPLVLGNNSKKGYHITLQLNSYTKKTFKKSELPPEFIQVDRLYSSVTMKTTNLINLASRIDAILQEILKMSSVMVYQILVKVRNHIGLFYKLCDDIAKLDVIQSLAQASESIGYIRPQFGDYLEITNSKHPLLDFLCSTEPVANSIFASRDHNVHIITGPNGSGKSVFIRQVLLLQVMAQIGSFIPAETAVVRVCDRMVARVYFDDNMDCGASAFVLEIKEMQYFHTVSSPNTLIIIDELCRSTAVSEGTTLAMAILETFSKSQAFIYLATHFIFVTKLEEFYPNVTNWQMECAEEVNERGLLKFTHSLVSGITSFKKYGLGVAAVSWPKDIMDAAEELYNQLGPPKQYTKVESMHILERLKYNLEAQLKMLKSKKQLTSDVLEAAISVYGENLKRAGLDIKEMDYAPEGSFPHDDDNPNITFQMNEDGELSLVLAEAVYSPEGDYQRFCQEIQARNLEAEHDDTALSLMISQNINRIVENQNRADSAGAESVHDVSELFKYPNSSIPWRSNSFESLEQSRLVEDPDVSAALEDLRECSNYFTQDWEELEAIPKESEEIAGTTAAGDARNAPKSNVIIHTVHIFGKNDELLDVQRFDRETGAVIEEIPQENISERVADRTDHSGEGFNFTEGGEESISVNNATFLTAAEEDDENFEGVERSFDTNPNRSFVMNFATPISNKTKSVADEDKFQLGSNSNHSFRIDFQTKPIEINCEKSFFQSTTNRDLTNQNTILTSNSNSFYSLRSNAEDTKRYSGSYNNSTHLHENPPKPDSQTSQKESLFAILNEMQRSQSSKIGECVGDANDLPVSALLTNSLRSTNLNRKDTGQKTFSNTFFEIQARNDALRILNSKEIAANTSLEPTDANGLENESRSLNLVSKFHQKSSNENLEMHRNFNIETAEDAGNRNIYWGGTCENTFDSSTSTLKLYPNRSLNTSEVSKTKTFKGSDRSNSNLIKITEEQGKTSPRGLNNDVLDTSGTNQVEGFENFSQTSSDLLEISDEDEKMTSQVLCDDMFSTSGKNPAKMFENTNGSNSNLSTNLNREDSGQKTFSNTFFEIQARNDALRILKSKEIAANTSLEPTDANGLENESRSLNLISEFHQKSSNENLEMHRNFNIEKTDDAGNRNIYWSGRGGTCENTFDSSTSTLKLYPNKSLNTSEVSKTKTFKGSDRSNSNLIKITEEQEKISARDSNNDVFDTSATNQVEGFENFSKNSINLLEISNEDEKMTSKVLRDDIFSTSGKNPAKMLENTNGSNSNLSKIINKKEKISPKMLCEDVGNTSGVNQTKRLQSNRNLLEIAKDHEKMSHNIVCKDVFNGHAERFENINENNDNIFKITKKDEKICAETLYKDTFNSSGISQIERLESFSRHNSNSCEITHESEKIRHKVLYKDAFNTSEIGQAESFKNFNNESNDSIFKITKKDGDISSKMLFKDVFNSSGKGHTKRFRNFNGSHDNLHKITNNDEEMCHKVLDENVFNTSGVNQAERYENANENSASIFKITKIDAEIRPKVLYKDVVDTSCVGQTESLKNINQRKSNSFEIRNENEKMPHKVLYKDGCNTSGVSQTESIENFDRNKGNLLLKGVFNTSEISQTKSFENFNGSHNNLHKITNNDEENCPKVLDEDVFNVSGVHQAERFDNLNESNVSIFKITKKDAEISPKVLYEDVFNTSGIGQSKRRRNSSSFEIRNENAKISSKVLYKDVLEKNPKKGAFEETEEKFYSENDIETKIYSPNLISDKIRLNKDDCNTSSVSQTEKLENADRNKGNLLFKDAFNTSAIDQTKTFENLGSYNNSLETTNNDEDICPKVLDKNVLNTSGRSQTKRLENIYQSNGSLLEITNENDKMRCKVLYKDSSLEENPKKSAFEETGRKISSGNDAETKKSSPNLILDKIRLNIIKKYENINKKEQNTDSLDDTTAMNVVESSQNLNDSRFKKLSKSLKRYFEPVENERISEKPTPNDDSLNRTFAISLNSLETNKSHRKSIFETSNVSESLFSSQDEFFSALDTSASKPKTPEKPATKKKIYKRKFIPPLKTDESKPESSKAPEIHAKRPRRRSSFVPPKRLSKKEILDDYDRQRKRVLENANDPDHIEEYMNFINNRPNVQQIQKQQYLAMIKRTNDGMEVLAPKTPITRPKKSSAIPLERKLSENEFHKILSDGNEGKLQSLLQTQEKMFDFDDANTNFEFLKENVPANTRETEFSQSFSPLMYDNNVIDDVIKKYLGD